MNRRVMITILFFTFFVILSGYSHSIAVVVAIILYHGDDCCEYKSKKLLLMKQITVNFVMLLFVCFKDRRSGLERSVSYVGSVCTTTLAAPVCLIILFWMRVAILCASSIVILRLLLPVLGIVTVRVM